MLQCGQIIFQQRRGHRSSESGSSSNGAICRDGRNKVSFYVSSAHCAPKRPSISSCTSNIIRASGRQALGAVLNLSAHWAFGLPLAAFLALYLHMGLMGQVEICLR